MAACLIVGEYGNAGRAALAWGPFILAYDQRQNPGLPIPAALGLVSMQPPAALEADDILKFRTQVLSRTDTQPRPAIFVTFADAGAADGTYRVWLRAPGVAAPVGAPLPADDETRSRFGRARVLGSIVDNDPASFVTTNDERQAEEDWFAVALAEPSTIGRVVFMHGKSFPGGGWFNTTAGRPQVQVQRKPNGRWETVGSLADYPSTTAANDAGLNPGQAFTLHLASPVSAVGVRVLGVPACGNKPKQAFSSCAELQAFEK